MGARALDTLVARGLLSGHALTDGGHATAERLIGARHDCLRSLVADWSPDDDPRVNDAIARLGRALARESPVPVV